MTIDEMEREMSVWIPSWDGEDKAVWADKYGRKLLDLAKAAKAMDTSLIPFSGMVPGIDDFEQALEELES